MVYHDYDQTIIYGLPICLPICSVLTYINDEVKSFFLSVISYSIKLLKFLSVKHRRITVGFPACYITYNVRHIHNVGIYSKYYFLDYVTC